MEMGGLHVGTLPFRFEGRGRDLLKPFLGALVLTVPTLGLVWFWYAARRTRYVAERTGLGGLSFAMPEVSAGEMFWLMAGNWLIMILTLGLFYPVTVHRTMRFWADHLVVSGQLDPASIEQIAASRADGEGLAGFFGIDTLAA